MDGFCDIFKILIKPRAVLLNLPQDRIRWIGFVVPVIIGLGAWLRKGGPSALGWGGMALVIVVVLGLVYPALGGAIKLFLRLFRREISFAACLNIFNYSQSPRLMTVLAFWGMALARQDNNTVLLLSAAMFGYVASMYSLYLLVRGVVLLSNKRQI